jgi:phosphoglycolate phosphatase
LLRRLNLEHYFTRIYGNVGVFGKAKMLRVIIARNKLATAETFYVGDEGRDVEAAKRVGLKPVSVTWGYNTHELLATHHPHALADTRQQLADILLRD